ncbi:MAG: permease-like cell division protein FtsX [Candidatus Saccharimonadales bacterium]
MTKKQTSKAFTQQKRKRRQWLTFMRMIRYGVNNFSRNTWLTIAATAVMTVTLLIIFSTLAARQVLVDTVDSIKRKVDMSIYVATDTTDEQAAAIRQQLEKIPSVQKVTYVSPGAAQQKFAEDNKSDGATLDALNEATNKLPGTFNIQIQDINDPSALDDFVKNNDVYKRHAHPDLQPSFSSDRRTAIERIANGVTFAERFGVIASVVFIVISSLIVFNTIRMAIFNRKEEIQMMKLIGADRSFIRGPFVVEAVVYGFVAALLATFLGIGGLYLLKDRLISGVEIESTIQLVTVYAPLVFLVMIGVGALIGVVSSLLATQKYLKL